MQLIPAPAGVLEVDALWQNDNPNDPNTDTVALLCHPNPLFDGTMNNKVVTTMYRFARDNGMHVVRFNFRGVGQSTGEHDYAEGEVVDAMTVLQWIAEQTNARKLWLGGFSFGGYVTARVAEQVLEAAHIWGLDDFDVSKIALIAPSVEKNDSTDIALPADKTFEIYGNADEVIEPDNMQAFADRLGIDVSVVDGAGHFFHGRLSELKGLLDKHSFGQDS
ncbi:MULTISPECIES: alpha/beta hydrolase [Psychrobacter]|jgi:alpha/beta superfamily hydrolase|uniref:alpha/beta hydrolase n=1 Tax=Psychrobacter TaxID=497 RepID=UPI000C331C1C|nr:MULTISPECIES: alpha/beta fold hydrolase [Psychrobacter]MBA6245606.1 alpha/beta fold hydrolase [Psychrobacter sp. Urea-trap-18]MBA6286164.1 alpha/beta fold hydrolase [Psychrobacter sp. Urea-trap-16]MBA6318198.1 alpha/beta fold hydrolase [Psychrobacter sp. Urea-trap-20]MBA6334352.1 alpha/beta fold hydrolase [Psychrobacter sp. Urea-trap-19]PKG60423.1 alpha/beta hydrolase [Psychrobacter sp. Choline-3u-12]|tara:strand:- start:7 stop:666 length:660 start_codon:yes stop_codon:yes gene_type:complete